MKKSVPVLGFIKKTPSDIKPPARGSAGAACFDIFSPIDESIAPQGVLTIHTGLFFVIPTGYHIKVYTRSGQGFKNHVTLLNGTGIIDEDYQGELIIGLRNDHPTLTYNIRKNNAIAQIELVRSLCPELKEVNSYPTKTARGEQGFGSTDSPIKE